MLQVPAQTAKESTKVETDLSKQQSSASETPVKKSVNKLDLTQLGSPPPKDLPKNAAIELKCSDTDTFEPCGLGTDAKVFAPTNFVEEFAQCIILRLQTKLNVSIRYDANAAKASPTGTKGVGLKMMLVSKKWSRDPKKYSTDINEMLKQQGANVVGLEGDWEMQHGITDKLMLDMITSSKFWEKRPKNYTPMIIKNVATKLVDECEPLIDDEFKTPKQVHELPPCLFGPVKPVKRTSKEAALFRKSVISAME